jgi:hypothetical protein
MFNEFLIILMIFFGGYILTKTLGLSGWTSMPIGFLIGVLLLVNLGFIQVVTGLPTTPDLTLIATLIIPLFFLHLFRTDNIIKGEDTLLVLSILVFALLVFAFHKANLVKYHIDSFRYILTSILLAENNFDLANLNLLTKRMLSAPLLHAPSRLFGEYYLTSITPLISLSLLASLCWFFAVGTCNYLNKNIKYLITILMVLLLLTNNRFIWNSFYINDHLFFAVCLTLIASSGWLLASTDQIRSRVLLGLIALSIPALIVTRPEAPLFAILAMAPILFSPMLDWKKRALILGVFGLSTTLWSGYVAMAYLEQGRDLPFSAIGPLILGLMALLAMPVLFWQGLTRYKRIMLLIIEIFLWLALFVLAFRDPEILLNSLAATYANVVLGAGGWGLSLVVLGVLVGFTLIFCRDPLLHYLRFPVTASIPLFFLLPYFRDGAYRVGHGDSLNRMLIHIVPLAVLFVAAAASSRHWGLPAWLRRGDDRQTAHDAV